MSREIQSTSGSDSNKINYDDCDVLRYRPSSLSDVEDVQKYVPGGLHPCTIGDTLENGRYKILHKLGCGGSSTVWLAKDQEARSPAQMFVSLKILAADRYKKGQEEVLMAKKLKQVVVSPDHIEPPSLQIPERCFDETGPNGRHFCVVSPLHGPSATALVAYTDPTLHMRLRAETARKMAKQVVSTIAQMHRARIAHGDISPNNVLFKLDKSFYERSESSLVALLGPPETEEVLASDGFEVQPSAPLSVINAADVGPMLPYLTDEAVVADFGQSMEIDNPPRGYVPAILGNYTPPEVRFRTEMEQPATLASDIWMLACTIYELRVGGPMFDFFFRSDGFVWMRIVGLLGKLPEPWWSMWEHRVSWYDDNGDPLPPSPTASRFSITAEKISFHYVIGWAGDRVDPLPNEPHTKLLQRQNQRVDSEEADLLADLLSKMLRYQPSDRIDIEEVLRHPWFDYMPST